MKQIAQLKNKPNEAVSHLFTFVVKQDFNEFVSLQEMRECIVNSYFKSLDLKRKKKREAYIASLNSFDFFDRDNYVVKNEKEFYGFINNLSSFRDELLIHIDLKFDRIPNLDSYGLSRIISPPLEAYDYIGHSKIDITSTGREYGLLFE